MVRLNIVQQRACTESAIVQDLAPKPKQMLDIWVISYKFAYRSSSSSTYACEVQKNIPQQMEWWKEGLL